MLKREEQTQIPLTNILYATHREDVIGGGEISLLELVRELDGKKFQAFLAAPAGKRMRDLASATGARLFSLRFPRLRPGNIFSAIATFLRLIVFIHRNNIKIVHANTSRAMIYCGPAARFTGISAVWHVRITDKDPNLDRFLYYLARVVICNSRATASRFDAFGKQEKIRIIHNGLDWTKYGGPFQGKMLKDLPESCRVILNIGRLEPEKGQELFIETAQKVKEKYQAVKFVLAGRDLTPGRKYRLKLGRKVRDLGLEGEVIFVGALDNIPEILGRADILVSTSRKESFGRALLEAGASGIPVVAFAVGGVGEVVEEGKTGFLVKEGDVRAMTEKILLLLSDSALRSRMGSRGREKVREEFNSALHARKMREVYETIP